MGTRTESVNAIAVLQHAAGAADDHCAAGDADMFHYTIEMVIPTIGQEILSYISARFADVALSSRQDCGRRGE